MNGTDAEAGRSSGWQSEDAVSPGSDLGARLDRVRASSADALRQAGRDASEVTMIVVTKYHPESLIRDLYALGVREFGENRHQEAQVKAAGLADLAIGWNFIGQLQSKKARQVRAYAKSVHSLDRESVIASLAARADDPAPAVEIDGFVQLNLTEDPGRGGIQESELERFTELVAGAAGIALRGVMAVAPIGEEPRAAFSRVRDASERMRAIEPTARFISMGMSGDFEEAILEGATHLRIGSAITGNRPPLS